MKTLATSALLLLALTGCNKDAPATATPAATPATAGTSAQDISNARSFLSHIYASYHLDAGLEAILPDEQVYAPELLAAIQANSKAYDGEVGYLDSDPLCQCQDTAQDLRALDFQITPLGDGRLRAATTLAGADNPLALDLTLRRHGNSWRVADVASPRAPSLLQALERDTQQVVREK